VLAIRPDQAQARVKSRAAICVAQNHPLEIDEIEVAGPRQGEVLIEIKASGLCHTDYHLIDGSMSVSPYPIVLGHEGAGVVVEVGRGVRSLAPGDHVLPVSMPECGQCRNCTEGRTNICLEFFKLFGADSPFSWRGSPVSQFLGCGTFSNYTTVKEIAVAKIRADAPFRTSCYISCGVATGIGSAIRSAQVRPGSTVVVFGLGGVGLNVLQGARIAGAARIIGIDINPDRETIARKLGATDFINPRNVPGDIVGLLHELTDGGADYAFECVGSPTLIRQAVESTRPGSGIAMMIGGVPTGQELRLDPMSLLLGRTLRGAMVGGLKARTDLPGLVDLYMQGQVKVDELITHYFPLERINEGFAAMKEGRAIRAVVLFDETLHGSI
jgi:S-(hydroxymethyl)glutathione dehydrogenase / alcohol dehydrogenase